MTEDIDLQELKDDVVEQVKDSLPLTEDFGESVQEIKDDLAANDAAIDALKAQIAALELKAADIGEAKEISKLMADQQLAITKMDLEKKINDLAKRLVSSVEQIESDMFFGAGDYPEDQDSVIHGDDEFVYTPHRLDYVSPTELLLNGGRVTTAGKIVINRNFTTKIEGTGTDNGAGSTISVTGFGGSKTYTVYLKRYADPYTNDPTLAPTRIDAYCVEGGMPAEADKMRQEYWLVGTFQTDSSGNIIESSVTSGRAWIGDVDDCTVVPDGNLDPVATPKIRTLQYWTTDAGIGQLEAWNAHAVKLAGDQSWVSTRGIYTLPKGATGAGDAEWIGTDTELDGTQKSITIDATKKWFEFNGIQAAAATPAAAYQDLAYRTAVKGATGFINSEYLKVGLAHHATTADSLSGSNVHPHSTHTDFASDDHTGAAGGGVVDRYLRHNGDASRNNMSGYIGDASSNKAISPNSRYLMTSSEETSVDWENRYLKRDFNSWTTLNWETLKLISDSGGVQVDTMCWDVSSTDWFLKWSATNWWNATNFLTNTSGKFELIAGASSKLDVTGDLSLIASGDIKYGTNAGITQASAVIAKITTTKGGVTALTTVTPAADGTYANPTSITIQDGHITAIS